MPPPLPRRVTTFAIVVRVVGIVIDIVNAIAVVRLIYIFSIKTLTLIPVRGFYYIIIPCILLPNSKVCLFVQQWGEGCGV